MAGRGAPPKADEASSTAALVAVTWVPKDVLGWAQAKHAEPLGGEGPASARVTVDPVVAAAIDSLGVLVGQHKPADQHRRAQMAKGFDQLRRAGYGLDPEAMHTYAIESGWRADNADRLRIVATRLNEGHVIRGMRSVALRDDVLAQWQNSPN